MPPKKPSSSSEDQPPPPHRTKFFSIVNPNVTQEDDAGAGTRSSPGAPAQGDVRERQAAPADTHAAEPVEQLAEAPADEEPAQVDPTGASPGDNAGN